MQAVKAELWDDKKYWDDVDDMKHRGSVSDQGAFDKHIFLRANHMCSWMIVRGTDVTSTVLLTIEFCDFLCTRYNFNPPKLQRKYDS